VAISTPSSGATTSGTVTVAGTASDSNTITKVVVSVDQGSPQTATGTTSWTNPVDTTTYTNGAHTITATATDSAGKSGTASLPINVSNSAPSGEIVANPALSEGLVLMGRGRMAEAGSLTVLLYRGEYSNKPWAYFRDSSTGAVSNVALPVTTVAANEWWQAKYVLTAQAELWVLAGNGPIFVREYQLAGGPLPTSATLVSTTTFGDADSRAGDLIELASGGLLGVWHQQGQLGPQGYGIAYRSPVGAWSTISPLQFMPSVSSYQAAVQNPSDHSIWIFSDADGWGRIGAVHLTEGASGVAVDWTNPQFIGGAADGENGPDPENPDVVAAPDPSTGTVALAYQDDHRTIFSSSPFVAGSYLTVARISPAGAKSFLSLPIYAERVASLGLALQPGETWLAYRPVDLATLTFDHLYVSRYATGSWNTQQPLGQLYTSYEPLAYDPGRAAFAARLSDSKLHFFGQ
jgi:hypothetical protein